MIFIGVGFMISALLLWIGYAALLHENPQWDLAGIIIVAVVFHVFGIVLTIVSIAHLLHATSCG